MKKILTFLTGISAILFLAGCNTYSTVNTNQSTNGSNTNTSQTMQAAQTFDVSLAEYSFTPNAFTLKKGETTNFNLTNDGKMTHTFSITELGVNESIGSGESRTISVTPDQTGTFELFCAMPGHRQLGMVGTITVE